MTLLGRDSLRRRLPKLEDARKWHRLTMKGLSVPTKACVGRFRGESGIEFERAFVGGDEGSSPRRVGFELARFERRLQKAVRVLDARIPRTVRLSVDGFAAVLDLAAWSHGQWLLVHPFVNGNGRTARMWANAILMRYGLPPVMRLRPRPGEAYELIATDAMRGRWTTCVPFLRGALAEYAASF
jgi:hypothetical protein